MERAILRHDPALAVRVATDKSPAATAGPRPRRRRAKWIAVSILALAVVVSLVIAATRSSTSKAVRVAEDSVGVVASPGHTPILSLSG
jgi:hypothetical protein